MSLYPDHFIAKIADPEEATQDQQHESMAIVKRLREATIKVLEEAQ